MYSMILLITIDTTWFFLKKKKLIFINLFFEKAVSSSNKKVRENIYLERYCIFSREAFFLRSMIVRVLVSMNTPIVSTIYV
jgi:hypothetical protein